jgi:hypothetical protein
MSRIDELFMTVIRLKRKLPEKVLGHMFCISQPTVSRIIRAWTVLLSKLIDCYPIENANDKGKSPKVSGKTSGESSCTSRGLGIPESFKQLFHCELAQSIVVTSVSAKDKKISGISKNTTAISNASNNKRCKKTRADESSTTDQLKPDLVSTENSANNKSNASAVDTDNCNGEREEDDTDSAPSESLLFNLNSGLGGESSEFFQALDKLDFL